MLRKFTDYYVKLLRYSVVSVFIGIIVGTIDAVFGRILLLISEFRDQYILFLLPFLPVAGVVIMLIYKKFSKESIKGMTLIFQTGHGEIDKIPKRLVPLVMFSTWITHLFGGSAGREGVAVQLGATIAHTIGRKLRISEDPRIFLIVGMASGFAGLFQTPLAATFFAMEVLVAGSILYEALLPALVGAYVASITSHLLGLEKFSIKIIETVSFDTVTVLKIILLGIIFGIIGGVFAHVLAISKRFFVQKIENPVTRIFVMACGISIMLLVLHMGRYSGLGTNLIGASFSGQSILAYDWIFKIIFTILTLSAGFQGGEVTPLFAIGASLGVVLASILGLPVILVAALGYIAVFGSATNTLFAPIFIGLEVFGPNNMVLYIVVCSLAYTFNGNKTIYSAQKKYSYLESIKG